MVILITYIDAIPFTANMLYSLYHEMLLSSMKVSHGDFGKGPEDDNFILNDE